MRGTISAVANRGTRSSAACKILKSLPVIRSFQNADLPLLHRLWMEHWSAIAPLPAVREAQIEQAVLSRTFFQADQLLVAESDQEGLAWLQFCQVPDQADDGEMAVIPAICLGNTADSSTACKLLEEAHQRIASKGLRRIQVGVLRDDLFGYAGLDPIGHGIGIPEFDLRLQQALQSMGYRVGVGAMAMTVSVLGFRPPVSRESLQFRRSTNVTVETSCQSDPRKAAGLSHLDVETIRLLDRSGQSVASLNLWFSDPEAEVMSPTRMIVEINEAHTRGRLEASESYLIGASIQLAAQRNILTAETSIDEDKTDLLAQLAALQFASTARGACWELEL